MINYQRREIQHKILTLLHEKHEDFYFKESSDTGRKKLWLSLDELSQELKYSVEELKVPLFELVELKLVHIAESISPMSFQIDGDNGKLAALSGKYQRMYKSERSDYWVRVGQFVAYATGVIALVVSLYNSAPKEDKCCGCCHCYSCEELR